MIKIGEDKGQQAGKHIVKQQWFKDNGIELTQLPLPVGDYIEITEKVQSIIDRRGDKLKKMDFMGAFKVTIDTKQDLEEVYNNLYSSKKKPSGKKESDHGRFKDELILAQQIGAKMYVLIEHGGDIKSIDDVPKWKYWSRIKDWESAIRKQYSIPRNADFEKEYMELKSHGAPMRKPPVSSETMYKAMVTMQEKYGCEFLFCTKEETGRRIIEILGGD